MELKELILELAAKQPKITTADILAAAPTRVSRQYANVIVRQLLAERALVKGGSTRNAFYVLPQNARLATALTRVRRRLKNSGLEEYEVWDDLKQKALFFPGLKENVRAILDYAFSEMLNNAIEHSGSETIEVELSRTRERVDFEVNDFGVGVFRNITGKKHLKNELEAIQELLKGKTTTNPEAHSGEGIFFTSKVADQFSLESYGYRLTIDNDLEDVFIEQQKPRKKGTRVRFSVAAGSRRHISDVFRQFQSDPEIQAFDKTEILVRLYAMGSVHVSRSQARRILSGLTRFRSIVLDFQGVPSIGQAFADEIFRVFTNRHPEVEIKVENAAEGVQFMINRAKATQR